MNTSAMVTSNATRSYVTGPCAATPPGGGWACPAATPRRGRLGEGWQPPVPLQPVRSALAAPVDRDGVVGVLATMALACLRVG